MWGAEPSIVNPLRQGLPVVEDERGVLARSASEYLATSRDRFAIDSALASGWVDLWLLLLLFVPILICVIVLSMIPSGA